MFIRQHCYHSVNSVTLENGQYQLCYLHIVDHLMTEIMFINFI